MSRRRLYILGFIVVAAAVAFFFDRSRSILEGPTSPLGYSVTIRCPDAGLGTGDNYRADVEIENSSGTMIAQWRDPKGQGSQDRLDQMLESMNWASPTALSFTSYPNQRIRLSIPAQP